MTAIIVGLIAIALIIIICAIYQGRLNAANSEKQELYDIIEDKDKRIEKLIEFKPVCNDWKIAKTKTGYQLDVYRNGQPWESYAEMDAEGVVATIISLT